MFRDKFFPRIISTARYGFGKKNAPNIGDQRTELTEVLRELCSGGANSRMYIDTCVLLHQYGSDLLDAIEKVFSAHHLKLCVPTSVLYELENVGNKDETQRAISRKMLEKITALEQNETVRIVLTNSPKFADAGLLSRFVTECQFHDIILLTQDREFAKKAQQLPSFLDGCVNVTHQIKAYKLTAQGSLIENDECHIIERKVFNHGKPEIYSKEQLPYPCFYSYV